MRRPTRGIPLAEEQLVTHRGGCHCGAVLFEVRAPADLHVLECNCSICRKTGFLHLIVPRSRFELIRGQEELAEYTFNTGTARHLFCKHCGVKSFYVPRSHPDGFSINVRCLEQRSIRSTRIEPFDDNQREQEQERWKDLTSE